MPAVANVCMYIPLKLQLHVRHFELQLHVELSVVELSDAELSDAELSDVELSDVELSDVKLNTVELDTYMYSTKSNNLF
jgi:uncharacterized protein YjbI with pentapeptide repeats